MATLFWVSSCALLIVNTFAPQEFKAITIGNGTIKKELPYFFALIPKSLNSNYVKRKLIKLPGVQQIIKVSESKVNNHVKEILSDSKVVLDDSLMALNFSGLKIYLSATLKESSRVLIRNYVSRLAGDAEVTLGALHKPDNKSVKSELFFNKYFSVGISFLAGLAFLITMLSFWKTLESTSFVYEQFQRKSSVFRKSLTYVHMPILVALIFGFFTNPTTATIGLGFLSIGLLMAFILAGQYKTR